VWCSINVIVIIISPSLFLPLSLSLSRSLFLTPYDTIPCETNPNLPNAILARKGIKDEYLTQEVFRMVDDLELVAKVNSKVKTLSGGQKRKLRWVVFSFCVGIFYIVLSGYRVGRISRGRDSLLVKSILRECG